MIDIHTHLLPGVDDGAKTMDASLAVLERFAIDGVTSVVCTPHLKASAADNAPLEHHRELLGELAARAPAAVRLLSGFEIMLDRPGIDLTAPGLSLGGSRAVLVEFPRTGIPPEAADELARLTLSGVVPVLAHPERYWRVTIELVRTWRAAGAIMQVDAAMFAHASPPGDFAREMVRVGVCDCISSDNHGDARSQKMAIDWLAGHGAEEQGRLLTKTNPERLLRGDALEPVPPVRGARGLFERLGDTLMGRER